MPSAKPTLGTKMPFERRPFSWHPSRCGPPAPPHRHGLASAESGSSAPRNCTASRTSTNEANRSNGSTSSAQAPPPNLNNRLMLPPAPMAIGAFRPAIGNQLEHQSVTLWPDTWHPPCPCRRRTAPILKLRPSTRVPWRIKVSSVEPPPTSM